MTDFIADFAIETTATTGTGTYSLGGAAGAGIRTLVAALGTGVTIEYVARTATWSKWERGRGVLTDGSPDTLTRVAILESSNANAAVDWQVSDVVYIHCVVSAKRFSQLRERHRGTSAPDGPLQAGMDWVDPTSVTAVLEKYYDGTGWITRPWLIDETADAFYLDTVAASGGARLTLTSALPVTTADVTAAGTIYVTPYKHNVTKLWNGTGDVLYVRNEISLTLNSNSGHTGYHQSGFNFDVYEYVRSGSVVIGTSPKWTDDTTRADALARRNGRVVNNASITLRFGTASGDTESVAANRANYLGTIRCTANGQTEDSAAKRFVWNMYNRVPRPMRRVDTTNTWNYSTATYQQANASTANQLAFVRGLDEDAVMVSVMAAATSSGATLRRVATGIGINSSTVNSAINSIADVTSASVVTMAAHYSGLPGLGYGEARWLEIGAGADTQTWIGDNGTAYWQSGMTGEVMA